MYPQTRQRNENYGDNCVLCRQGVAFQSIGMLETGYLHILVHWIPTYTPTLSQNYLKYPHKNRACESWSRINNTVQICFCADVNKLQTFAPAVTGSVFIRRFRYLLVRALCIYVYMY